MREKDDKRESNLIQSLDKGLRLLEVIAHQTYPISLNTLWQKLKWDKASILRMCNTLERRGYVHKDPSTKMYTPGLKILGLYESITNNIDCRVTARPYLEQLGEETGESAHLGIILNKSVVFADKVLGRNTLAVNVQIGGSAPLHCTALGKAYLAHVDPVKVDTLIEDPLQQLTENTVNDVDSLKTALQDIRSNGFAVDDEEYVAGVRCVAAPIFNVLDHPIAVIGISGPATRLSVSKCGEYGLLVRQCAQNISTILGSSLLAKSSSMDDSSPIPQL